LAIAFRTRIRRCPKAFGLVLRWLPRVLAMLGVGLLHLGGQFTAFTDLTPFLGWVTGISGGLISLFLLAFGIAAAAGPVLRGRAADRDPTRTPFIANAVLIGAIGALYLAGAIPVLVVVALAAWGGAEFAIVPSVQLRVITLARAGGDLASTLAGEEPGPSGPIDLKGGPAPRLVPHAGER